MRRALMSWCAVTALATAVVTGCGDSGVGAGDAHGQTRQDTGVRTPALTWREEARVNDALQRLTSRCMGRQGFVYQEERELTLQESRPVRFVQDDPAWAEVYGYGSRIETKSARLRERNVNGTYRQNLPATRRALFDQALDGGDSARMLTAPMPGGGEIRKRIGGCTEEAERTLYGDPAEWFRTSKTALSANYLYAGRLMKDPQLTAAVRGWSACMREAGEPYPDPQAAQDGVRAAAVRRGAARADESFAAERRTAVADAGCARRTRLRAVATAREKHYLDHLPDRYVKDIDTYRRLGRQAYDRAVRIVPERD
ncbi:hypothetical protein ABZ883_34540 [Streptomyces sp. NPDC046977]|uniref:hypothetical protein n=1 Tax=Streptomyces sp. NPDC046977 TaxID=3154703 RepID=UPI0033F8A18C